MTLREALEQKIEEWRKRHGWVLPEDLADELEELLNEDTHQSG